MSLYLNIDISGTNKTENNQIPAIYNNKIYTINNKKIIIHDIDNESQVTKINLPKKSKLYKIIDYAVIQFDKYIFLY